MLDYITDGGVVDIFVELVELDVDADKEDSCSDWENKMEASEALGR